MHCTDFHTNVSPWSTGCLKRPTHSERGTKWFSNIPCTKSGICHPQLKIKMWVTPAFASLESWTCMSKERGLGSDGVRECKHQGLHHGFQGISPPSRSANPFFGILFFLFYQQIVGVLWFLKMTFITSPASCTTQIQEALLAFHCLGPLLWG